MGYPRLPAAAPALASAAARSRVEFLSRLCRVDEELRRCEALAVLVSEPEHLIDNGMGADGVNPHKGTAQKWREPDAEDGADVAVARRLDDAVLPRGKGKRVGSVPVKLLCSAGRYGEPREPRAVSWRGDIPICDCCAA